MIAVRLLNLLRLPPAVLPAGQVRTALLPTVHLIAFALVSWIVLGNNRPLLLAAYDGHMIRVMARLQLEWGTALPVSAGGPFEGLANAFFPTKTHYWPSYLVACATTGKDYDPRAVYWVIALELFVMTWLVGRVFRLPAGVIRAAAWLAPVLILSMCYFHGTPLFLVNSLAPQTAECSAGAMGIVVLFAGAGRGGAVRAVVRGTALYVLIVVLTVAGPAAVVLWAPPTALLLAFQVWASETRREAIRKIAMLAGVGAVLALTALPFLAGTFLYTVPSFFAAELQNDRASLFMVSSLFHTQKEHQVWAGRPLIALALLGSLVAGVVPGSRQTRAFGRFLFATLAGIIGIGLYVTFVSQNYRGPAPSYFEYVVWPYCVLAAVYGVYALGLGAAWVVGWAVHRVRANRPAPVQAESQPQKVVWVTSVAWIVLVSTALLLASTRDYGQSKFHPYQYPPAATPIVKMVTRELALAPGQPFRGSAAAFYGSKREPGTTNWFDHHGADLAQVAARGTDFRSTGFWHNSVPTLWEYSPFITPSVYMATTRMLSDLSDKQLRSVTVLTRPHAAYLQSLGVRFVTTDLTLPAPFVLRETEPASGPAKAISLYELPDANLGGYSPTEMIVCADARAAVARLAEPGFDFHRNAVVAAPVSGDLVPGTGQVRFKRGGVVVIEGSSAGRSALLLPIQYTRCWRMRVCSSTGGDAPELIQMNVAQAGLVFSGTVKVELEFVHGPFANSWGRLRDYLDFRAAYPK